MAARFSDVTADLEALVSCGVCKNTLKKPKTLRCLHTFCFHCLEDWYKQSQNDGKPFNCPTCAKPISVEAGNFDSLPTSFEHYTLIEIYNNIKASDQQQSLQCSQCSEYHPMAGFCFHCDEMLCNLCYSVHNIKESHLAKLWNQVTIEDLNTFIDHKFVCQEKYHEKCRLEYYCQSCKKTICQKCASTVHSYRPDHKKVSLEEACEHIQHRLRQEKQRLLKVVELHENEQKLSYENLQRIQNQVKNADAKLLEDLKVTIDIMQDKVNGYRAILTKYLEDQTKDNDEEKKKIDDKLEQARSLRNQCEKMENSNLKQFIVNEHEKLENVCKTAITGTPILPTRPVTRCSNIYFVPNPEALKVLQDLDLGKIVESKTDPSHCTIESVRETRCGFVNQFNIITRDAKGNECYTDEALIDVQIQDNDGNHVNKEITQSQPGTFIVKFKANKPFPYKIEVSIGGTPVSNSPQVAVTVDAKAEFKPVRELKITRQAGYPSAMAVSDNGLIAVSRGTYGNHFVEIYTTSGKRLSMFGNKETEREACLHIPFAVAFTNGDHVLVSDNHDNHGMIKLFDIYGNYKRLIHKEKGIRFTGMCTTNQGIACLAYKNSENASIKLFSKQLCDLHCDIKLDIRLGVSMPCDLAYDNNKYFVNYFGSYNCIYVFNENGSVLNKFGKEAVKEGQFESLRGLAVFGADMLLVCDYFGQRVHLFHQDGHYITSFDGRDTDLVGDMDVAVAPDGQVFVLDFNGQRVQVFR